MRVHAAIIGGTGIGSRLAKLDGFSIHVPTPFGLIRCKVIELDGVSVSLVQRHSSGHSTPPHLVNYRGMALATRALGAKACFGSAAVGSLRPDWPVGSFSVCSDFLDLTARNLTLFDREVTHTDFSHPFAPNARGALLQSAADLSIEVYDGGVYVNGNGPRYETPKEVTLYREFGGDVVGMTAASEAIAMGEAGVPYACLAISTNLACGLIGASLSHQEVVDEMQRSGDKAVSVLLGAAKLAAAWP